MAVGMTKTVTKLDAARRQLLAALHIHWYLKEPLAVYSLASAAWNVANDLLKRQGQIRSIEQIMRTHNLSERDAGLLIRASWNFAKHADNDPDAELLDFSDEDCDSVLVTACLDYAILSRRAPAAVQVFLVWYSAVYPQRTGKFMRDEANDLFPDLANIDRGLQVQAAREAVTNLTRKMAGDTKTDLSDNWRWVKMRDRIGDDN